MASSDDNMDETMKYKVSKVLEMHPNKNKHEVIVVLQYFDCDVDTAINAYTEGNIPDLLRRSNSNSVRLNNKNKRKKKKNKKASLGGTMAPLLNENNVAAAAVVKNDADDDDQYEMSSMTQPSENVCKVSDASERVRDVPENNTATSQNGESPSKYVSNKPKIHESLEDRGESVTSQSPENVPDINISPKKTNEFAKPYQKNRHRSSGSFSQSRTTSLSEETSSQASFVSSLPAGPGKISLDKSMKDLSRQTVALSRVNNILEEELENSFKRIKTAISEAQKLLEERSAGLEQEMEKVKKDSRSLLNQRKEIAAELKQRTERAATLTETELKELRDDIKHFVVERKFDDELGKTVRFMWDKDRITQEIRNFGEVHHVKNSYSQRRQSVSSVASSTCLTSSALDSPNEQKIPNLADLKEGGGDETSRDQSSDPRPHNSTTTIFQGRSRVFFSSTRPHYGSNSDYGGGNGNFNAGGPPSTVEGRGGATGGGGSSNQTRPGNYRHYQQGRGRGGGGHYQEGRGGGGGGGPRGGRGYYNKPHFNNNQRYNNNNNTSATNQGETEESSGGNNNRRPPPRRGAGGAGGAGGRNPRFQNHNQGRSYHHHRNDGNNNNSNVNSAATNRGVQLHEGAASKEVRVNDNKNVESAHQGNKPTLVNGFVSGNH